MSRRSEQKSTEYFTCAPKDPIQHILQPDPESSNPFVRSLANTPILIFIGPPILPTTASKRLTFCLPSLLTLLSSSIAQPLELGPPSNPICPKLLAALILFCSFFERLLWFVHSRTSHCTRVRFSCVPSGFGWHSSSFVFVFILVVHRSVKRCSTCDCTHTLSLFWPR